VQLRIRHPAVQSSVVAKSRCRKGTCTTKSERASWRCYKYHRQSCKALFNVRSNRHLVSSESLSGHIISLHNVNVVRILVGLYFLCMPNEDLAANTRLSGWCFKFGASSLGIGQSRRGLCCIWLLNRPSLVERMWLMSLWYLAIRGLGYEIDC